MVQAFTSPKLNTPEAAKYLGLRPGTLEIWRFAGQRPSLPENRATGGL